MSGKDSVKSKPRNQQIPEKHVSTSGVPETPHSRADAKPEHTNDVANLGEQQRSSKSTSRTYKTFPCASTKQSTFVGASIHMKSNGVFSSANAAVSIFASSSYSRPIDNSSTHDKIASASHNSIVVPIESSTTSVQKSETQSEKSFDRLHAIIVCGPSGSGKSTLLKKLISEFSDCFAFCISRKINCITMSYEGFIMNYK